MKTILILEDHPDAMDLLRGIVQEAFPRGVIDALGTQSDALARVAAQRYDLALVDLHLPDGSGVEVISAINQRWADTRIVVTSIYDDDGHLFPALQAGAQGYLVKDDPRSGLVRQLTGILDGTPPLSPAIARKLIRHFGSVPRTRKPEHSLSPREVEALGLLAQGISVKRLAQVMSISPHTAGDHVKSIYRKLNITSRAEAALKATELGLLPPN